MWADDTDQSNKQQWPNIYTDLKNYLHSKLIRKKMFSAYFKEPLSKSALNILLLLFLQFAKNRKFLRTTILQSTCSKLL